MRVEIEKGTGGERIERKRRGERREERKPRGEETERKRGEEEKQERGTEERGTYWWRVCSFDKIFSP